jgi:uncharacterized protein YeeX (DUF496 family)
MDKQFLEFWGNAFLSVAKGQQQLDDFVKWLSGSFREFQDITSLFNRFYGLNAMPKDTPDYFAIWEKAMGQFRGSFQEFLTMMDFVSRKDYIDLSRENEDLKKRVAEQEEAISHLRTLLHDKVKVPDKSIQDFQALIDEQARHYQEFMKSIGKAFEASPGSPEPQGESAGRGPEKAKPKAKPAKSGGKPQHRAS